MPRRLGRAGRGRSVGSSSGATSAQRVPPVIELAGELVAVEPGALPHGEVGVLDRQLRQRRGLAGGEGAVERRRLAHQHAHRPAVRHRVVHHQQQQVIVVGQAAEPRAQERRPRQVEAARGVGRGAPARLRLAPCVGQGAEIVEVELEAGELGRHDLLARLSVVVDEAGAQDLVPAHHLGQRALERGRVERPGEPECHRHVVERAARVHLLEEPEPLLGERQRQRAGARDRAKRRRGPYGIAGHRVGDPGGHGGQGGGLEHGAHRQLDAEAVAHAGEQLGGAQRVAAQGEEVVVAADAVDAEQRGPDGGQRFLNRAVRLCAARARAPAAPAGRRGPACRSG